MGGLPDGTCTLGVILKELEKLTLQLYPIANEKSNDAGYTEVHVYNVASCREARRLINVLTGATASGPSRDSGANGNTRHFEL